MKKMILLISSLFLMVAAKSQTFQNTGSGLNQLIIDKEDTVDEEEGADEEITTADNEGIENIFMEKAGKTIEFSGLEGIKKHKVYITNSNGIELIIKEIDKKQNVVNIGKLKKGIYFATIVEETKDKRKSFVLTIE